MASEHDQARKVALEPEGKQEAKWNHRVTLTGLLHLCHPDLNRSRKRCAASQCKGCAV